MAAKTFYWKNAVPAGATLHRSLQDGGTPPTTATTATGWVAGTNAAGRSCIQTGGTEYSRTGGNWGTTLQPASNMSQTIGDCWRSENTLDGSFANANWTFVAGFRSVTAAYTGRLKLAVRVWRTTNANGTGGVELTAGRVASGATVANLSTSADTTLTWTWSPGAIKLFNNEYLFVQMGIEITSAGGGTTQDFDFRVGSAYTLTTPDFTASVVHANTGALGAQSATEAGTAARFRAHATNGALTGQSSTAAGTAARTAGVVTHAATGALTGEAGTIGGTAEHIRVHATTGALAGQAATGAGTTARKRVHATTGTLAGQEASATATSVRNALHTTTGTLGGQAATAAGAATRTRQHAAAGALAGADANLAGVAAYRVLHATTADLMAIDALITGAAIRSVGSIDHVTVGELQARSAMLDGAAHHRVTRQIARRRVYSAGPFYGL